MIIKKIIYSALFLFIGITLAIQQSPTDILINYFDKLVTADTLTVDHLRNLSKYKTLQNPILDLEVHADSKLLNAYV